MLPNFDAKDSLELVRNPPSVLPSSSPFPLCLEISRRIDSLVFDVTLSIGDDAYLDQHIVVKLAQSHSKMHPGPQ